jgi:hypothetical protein
MAAPDGGDLDSTRTRLAELEEAFPSSCPQKSCRLRVIRLAVIGEKVQGMATFASKYGQRGPDNEADADPEICARTAHSRRKNTLRCHLRIVIVQKYDEIHDFRHVAPDETNRVSVNAFDRA